MRRSLVGARGRLDDAITWLATHACEPPLPYRLIAMMMATKLATTCATVPIAAR
jgi:hypothetical protein